MEPYSNKELASDYAGVASTDPDYAPRNIRKAQELIASSPVDISAWYREQSEKFACSRHWEENETLEAILREGGDVVRDRLLDERENAFRIALPRTKRALERRADDYRPSEDDL